MISYQLELLVKLIDLTRPLSNNNESWMIRYLRLQSLFVYFQYSVASVNAQSDYLTKMYSGLHKNFKTHQLYEDYQLKVYCNGVSAYSFMYACFQLTSALIGDYTNIQSVKLKEVVDNYSYWVTETSRKRSRIGAHPDGGNRIPNIIWKRSSENDIGDITFRVINIREPLNSEKLTIEPKKDLEELKKYLTELSDAFWIEWQITSTTSASL